MTDIIKNSLAPLVDSLRSNQKMMNDARSAIHTGIKELEKSMQILLERTLKEFNLENYVSAQVSVHTGCETVEHWKPRFLITHIKPYKGAGGFTSHNFIKVGPKWVATNKNPSYNETIHRHELDFERQLKHIDLADLDAACLVLTEKTGLPVETQIYRLVNKQNITVPQSTNDLLTMHPGSCIALEGSKMNVGWDIGDPWAILRTKKGSYIIYYSTSGHFFGYDTCVMPDRSARDFLAWLGDKPMVQMTIPSKILKRLEARV